MKGNREKNPATYNTKIRQKMDYALLQKGALNRALQRYSCSDNNLSLRNK